ncbi:hypothetical protein AAHA92_13924 [Salvia divinorum]|uniref:Uncharacterized protein n=1 Tax=Salvia divinorum TaxID=28513 RepID=A0ABD1H9W5_SALDI
MMSNNEVVHRLQDAQQEQKAAMDMLNKQLSQIATSLNEMRGTEGRIPATVKMPGKDNVSMITLRPSGSEGTDGLTKKTVEAGDESQREDLRASLPERTDPFFLELEMANEKKDKEKDEEEVLPPKSASKKIVIDDNPPVTQELPSKHADPGVFVLPITVGGEKVDHAICNLGASINVLPLSVFQRMERAVMTYTDRVIQLADGSCIKPVGILENATVKVQNFLYPADFHVIRMSDTDSAGSSRVLLGRPFLKTAKAIIDVFEGTISLRYHGKKYTFGADRTTLSMDMEELNAVSIAKPPVQEASEEEKSKENLAGEVMKLEREAAEWLEDTQTRGLTDQELSEAIMSFCQVPKAAEPGGCCKKGNAEDLPKTKKPILPGMEGRVCTKVICEEIVSVIEHGRKVEERKLRHELGIESGFFLKEVNSQEERETVEVRKKGSRARTEKKGVDSGEIEEKDNVPLTKRSRGKRNTEIGKSILPLTYPLIPRPKTCEELRLGSYDSASWEKEMTKLEHDRDLKSRERKIEQRVLLFQSKQKLMPEKWKSQWTKPFTIGALGVDRAIGLRDSPPNAKSSVICFLKAKVGKDRSVLGVVREISLRMTVLSSI